MFSAIKNILFQTEKEKFSYLRLILGIVLLLFLGIKLIKNFNHVVDVSFDDEVQYLRYGLDMFEKIRTDWGPSYNLWYKFLSVFEQDPILLYLLNYKLLILLFPISIFVFLYVYRCSFFISFWISFSLLISTTNILTYPRISHFAVCVLLWVLSINKLFVKSEPKKYILTLFAVFIAAFARPELMLSFIILSIIVLFILIKKYNIKEYILFALPFLVFMLMVYFWVGTPSSIYKGIDRTYIAFCQHYTIKYILQHKESFNLFIDWIAFSKEQFPGCETFKDIVLQYPLVVIKGFFFNTGMFFLLLIKSITDVIYPYQLFPIKTLQNISFSYLFILLILVFCIKKYRKTFLEQASKKRMFLLLLVLFALPSIASSIVFFPRMHYMHMLLPLIAFFMAILLDTLLKLKHLKIWVIVPFLALFYFKTPNIIRFNTPAIVSGSCPNQSYKKFVRDLNKETEGMHVIFSNIHNLSMMTNGHFKDFGAEYEYNNQLSFTQQIQQKKADYILVTEFLLDDRRLRKDSTWHNFIQDPNKFGFQKKMLFKDCPTYLLFKESK
jgi:hypothetical protein